MTWAFDLGLGSIGEAISQVTVDSENRPDVKILHAASLLIPPEFGSISEARTKRRAKRTREAHRAREAWLDRLWKEAGLEPLKRRTPYFDPSSKKWIPEKCQPADYRLEREFPPARQKKDRNGNLVDITYANGKAKDGAPAAKDADFEICYNSALLRIKLLRDEKLEEWQIYKALHAALQRRGQHTVPWIAREAARAGKTPEEIEEEERKALEKKDPAYKDAMTKWQNFCQLDGIKNHPEYQYPCYYDAYQIGLWNPSDPENLKIKPDHMAQSTQQIVFPGERIEAELLQLAENAARQLPQLQNQAYEKNIEAFLKERRQRIQKINQKRQVRAEAQQKEARLLPSDNHPQAKDFAELFVYGPAGRPNLPKDQRKIALADNAKVRALALRPGTHFDHQSAIGQKIPRFDNRILATCALIPRLHVCKAAPKVRGDHSINEDSLLACEVTFLQKLKNLRVMRDGRESSLTAEQIKKIFDEMRAQAIQQQGTKKKPRFKAIAEKFSLTKARLVKFGKKTDFAFLLHPMHEEIATPKVSGRSRFSRPALKIIKTIILSGKSPREVIDELKSSDSELAKNLKLNIFKENTPENKVKGLTHDDPAVFEKCGDSWEKFYIPDTSTAALLAKLPDQARSDKDELIKKIIGTCNNPIVRHRVELFYKRLKQHKQQYGEPGFIALEFTREDFMGEEAKKKLQREQNRNKKLNDDAAYKIEELGLAGRRSMLKYKLWKQQGGQCLYTGGAIGETQVESCEIEHIVPRNHPKVEGSDAQWNLVLTRRDTNERKGNRTPFEWFQQDPQAFQWPMAEIGCVTSTEERKRLWGAYCARVDQHKKSLGYKRAQLLIAQNAAELVERSEGLATTATIARLALRVVDLLFDWNNGNDADGNKRVQIFPGGRTAAIRRRYLLDTLLGSDGHQKLENIQKLRSEIAEIRKRWPQIQGEEYKINVDPITKNGANFLNSFKD